ncbi:MAG: hypothetical protein A3I44_05560 [Candidatus Sungbacteria bacterium RIFCSPLOWO2_02_FULL_51_17]|uniref:Major facilitator superfamily (MFS) profile domain-containing protein n=1 Tax=Candidatus Sungbacteria bacterium RIFCSPHIGHO2_02_FULL_51_29 TaxID=1802273 RepID=A0A1G2KRR2_9BACT|nr:MAG: hypothetical protein A2676_03885 [Candidatus Sungbacteria bacterium RIFCSPHIGHO2_01_FULL_51_22]OHA01974.1 MAG: hypothetical protein A3C16_02440 [Candidatus Sungbacteria bacterium RIFCSPHIGHO2_02_FULL_51_29]OHA06498.1 MAG: hypothetical protein A3B29_02980 [Candidatus Sungbacteria bacterium RIFCSPLOWO2_01_FULL_51_34]OHA11160.1 MAG: hypothetical protein A3I44_05560 [Candidatus Sungbacteria bacterium RIFCSPLOWO2_02_FULL_51_17]
MHMNVIVQTLIIASFVFEAGFGMFAPVFAVFVTTQIPGGDIAVVGFATGVYWILKSLLQIPVGRYLDKKEGETDDLYSLWAGYFLMGLVVFLYQYIESPLHLYVLQALLAVGGALAVPAWYGMFLRNIDHHKESFEWSINSSLSFGFGTGGAGMLGGYLAQVYGFHFIFVTGALLIWGSLVILFVLRKHLRRGSKVPIPKPPFPL